MGACVGPTVVLRLLYILQNCTANQGLPPGADKRKTSQITESQNVKSWRVNAYVSTQYTPESQRPIQAARPTPPSPAPLPA